MKRHGSAVLVRIVIAVLAIATILLTWQALLIGLDTPGYMFPKPSDIGAALVRQPMDVYAAWSATMKAATIGIGIAVVLSTFLAAASFFLPSHIGRIISVGATSLQSTPLLAIAPLLTLWFGLGLGSKVAAATVICFFPILVGWLAGSRSIDEDYVNLFENMGATKVQAVVHLVFPSALPYFFGGLRVAAPLSILGAIVGEFVGASEGLGYRILSSSYYLRTADMFAYVIVAGVTGWLLAEVVQTVERRVLFWRGKGRV